MPLTPQPTVAIKIIEIGDWDMLNDGTWFAPHGLKRDNIREVSAIIRNDPNTPPNNKLVDFGSANKVTAVSDQSIETFITNIVLTRAVTGFFDSTAYNQINFNRGWVVIKYIANLPD